MNTMAILAMCYSNKHGAEEQLFPKSVDCEVLYNNNTASSALFSSIGNIYLFWFGKQLQYTVGFISCTRVNLHSYFLLGLMLLNYWTLPIAPLHVIVVVLNGSIVLKSNFYFCLLATILALQVMRP